MATKTKKTKDASTLQIIRVGKEKLDNALEKKGGPVVFLPKCHPKSVCRATFEEDVLKVYCWQCDNYMMEILVDEDDDFQVAPCDKHPDHYGAVILSYDGKKLNITCGIKGCKEKLHSLKVKKE